jgi:hypothetical protein
MFGWLFKTADTDDWAEAGLRSAAELRDLAASNSVVSAQVDTFLERAQNTDPQDLDALAISTAKAVSGYGTAVSKGAFLDLLRSD